MPLTFSLLRPFELLRDARAAAALLDLEEFSGRKTLEAKVNLALTRLYEHRMSRFTNRQRYLAAEDRLAEVRAERDALQAKVERMTGNLKRGTVRPLTPTQVEQEGSSNVG